MTKKLIITAVVVAGIGLVIWFKPAPPAPEPQTAAPASSELPATATTVLLFADPREAESSCGCAEIIRLARSADAVEGVAFREIDSRQPDQAATQYAVRVSPTVLIVDTAGDVRHRFEGESRSVIDGLRTAINDLSATTAAAN